MQQESEILKNGSVEISNNTSQRPLFRAIQKAEECKIIYTKKGKKIFKPPKVLALHKADIQNNFKYFEVEIEGNVESSYIIKICIKNNIISGFCFCKDFNFKKRACKHILAAIMFLKKNQYI